MALMYWSPNILRRRLQQSACKYPFRQLNSSSAAKPAQDVEAILAHPSWSVKALFADDSTTSQAPPVSQKQLHHLLRLSALPLPTSVTEEKKMIADLQSQLRFVQAIQSVDTEGVEPLVVLRDETEEAERENEITLESLKDEFAKEEAVGMGKRIRRRKELPVQRRSDQTSADALIAQAQKRVGRLIVVDTAKD